MSTLKWKMKQMLFGRFLCPALQAFLPKSLLWSVELPHLSFVSVTSPGFGITSSLTTVPKVHSFFWVFLLIDLFCSRCILQSDMKPGNTPHFSCSTHTFLWPLNPNDPQVLYYCCKPLLCCLTRWKKHAACKAPMKGCQDEVRHEHLISQREFQETEHYFTTWKLSGQWDPVYNQRGWGIYLIDCTSPGTSLVL